MRVKWAHLDGWPIRRKDRDSNIISGLGVCKFGVLQISLSMIYHTQISNFQKYSFRFFFLFCNSIQQWTSAISAKLSECQFTKGIWKLGWVAGDKNAYLLWHES